MPLHGFWYAFRHARRYPLAEGHLMEEPGEFGDYEIEVREDGPIAIDSGRARAASQVTPYPRAIVSAA